MKRRISRDPLRKIKKRPFGVVMQGDLVMTRTGVVVVWNARLKPDHGLRKVRILAGPELLEKVDAGDDVHEVCGSETTSWWESSKWKDLRRKVLKRDHNECQRCRREHYPEWIGLTAHHIIPLKDGGNDAMSNLITLCETCHDIIEGRGLNVQQIKAGDNGYTLREPGVAYGSS